jgi:hypothetical protein
VHNCGQALAYNSNACNKTMIVEMDKVCVGAFTGSALFLDF